MSEPNKANSGFIFGRVVKFNFCCVIQVKNDLLTEAKQNLNFSSSSYINFLIKISNLNFFVEGVARVAPISSSWVKIKLLTEN